MGRGNAVGVDEGAGTGAGTGPGAGARTGEAERFGGLMRELKGRAGLSYGALARTLHTSTSTLHRYCNAEAVPAEFAVVDRFARACGASRDEAVDLHRAWLLADARRRDPAGPPAAGAGTPGTAAGPAAAAAGEPGGGGREARTVGGAGAAARAGAAGTAGGVGGGEDGGGGAGEAAGTVVVGSGRAGAAARRPWSRRRAVVAAAAGVTAGAVAVAVLAAAGPEGTPPPSGAAGAPASASAPAVPAPPGPSASAPASGATSAEPSAPAPVPGSATAPRPLPDPSAPPAAGPGRPAAVPVRAAVRTHVWQLGCDHSYLSERAPDAVPAPPVEADAPAWAAAQRAVHAGTQILEVTVHGADPGAVVLEGLDVRMGARRTPPKWNVYRMAQGCGGALTPAVYAVNLDAPRPVARPVAGGDEDGALPAPAFPMRVSASEPVVLRIEATTTGCDCDWSLDLRWSGPAGSGTLRIDDAGRPLRTSAAPGRPEYGYASDRGRWTR
ncbi:helix-turn-helix domain-containing protein [Streptomyces subrutilus]|uniref:helix-turn-helix domain-containing protein n=1 Tax=Streptomyces subrutilus TaxID=36818 RepID=UPI00343D7CC4